MKNSKGISMITLIITMVVMIILASIVLIAGDDSMETADRAKIGTEKKSLQEAIQSRFAGYMRNSATYPLVGATVNSDVDEIVDYLEEIGREDAKKSSTKSEIEAFLEKNINNEEYNRIINYSDMLALEMKNVSNAIEYSYIVNYYSLDVVGPIY